MSVDEVRADEMSWTFINQACTQRGMSHQKKSNAISDLFAAALRARRTELGITQEALSRSVGTSANTTYRIESGTRRPSLALLQAYCDELEITASFTSPPLSD